MTGVTLMDMGDTAGPDVSMADLSLLRLRWPVPVVSSMNSGTTASHLQKAISRLSSRRLLILWKKIKLDMGRHMANYHLELAHAVPVY